MELTQAHLLALRLIREHRLEDEWTFKFDKAVRRFGCCNHSTKTISLSKKLTELNDEDQVKDTILHEIAHALVGVENGHNRTWKRQALAIGCNATRCYSTEVVKPPARWIGTCPNGHSSERQKRMKVSCSRCDNKYNPDYLIVYTRNETEQK